MDSNILDKIRKLLAIAERATTNIHERDAALNKVSELCSLYGIEQDRIHASPDRKFAYWDLKRTFHLDLRCAAGKLSNIRVLTLGKQAMAIGRPEFISLSETIYDYLLKCMSNHQAVYRQTLRLYLKENSIVLSPEMERKFIEDNCRNFRKAFAQELFYRASNKTTDTNNSTNQPGQQLACVNFEKQEHDLNTEFFQKQFGVDKIKDYRSRAKITGAGKIAGKQAAQQVNLDPQLQ